MGCSVSYMADEKKRLRGNEIGPTGQTVAANLKRLRGGISLRELQERLRSGGHEISASGLQKIEAGVRRVDVDDLLALAVALEVTPNSLLFPPHADAREAHLTGAAAPVPSVAAWLWADGHEPLWKGTRPTQELSDDEQQRRQDFYLRSLPRPDYDPEESRQMKSEYSARWRVTIDKEFGEAEVRLRQLAKQMEELQGIGQRLQESHGDD